MIIFRETESYVQFTIAKNLCNIPWGKTFAQIKNSVKLTKFLANWHFSVNLTKDCGFSSKFEENFFF